MHMEGDMRLQGNRRGTVLLVGVTLLILLILVVGYVIFMPR